ncbi:alpha/beta fold hydrolase [Pseudochryseolinea flava]|uniref:Alpha/beta hydrolase n=1 Tax=Pseudochryseolinea flava TaxID=2059302 RepID=A0A364YC00_9BACT|nr:alpha/beta fold hydrolase [Pseudochryseolinea flava]RAW03278.1 alpha/beta hydrolase [Pseudochryseolinea flava]
MKLFFREYNPASSTDKQPIVILHGLFGSSDNWLTQAKVYSETYNVYTVDLRNHGQSPHDDAFDYQSMVNDLEEFFADHNLSDVTLIGHSMGGKAAMNFALAHPDRVGRLIVVDIAPRYYDLEHYVIVDGLNAVKLNELTSRNDADAALSEYVPEPDVRQFLLKNLQRKAEGGFSWKINLPVISEKLSNIGVDLVVEGTFEKPTLFIRGVRSKYVHDSDWSRIKEIFPEAVLETMETGHWVQAENPQGFVALTKHWIESLG